jgi:hypothetical protein
VSTTRQRNSARPTGRPHERALTRGVDVLNLDHYLEVLVRKPGVLPGATALTQAAPPGVHRQPRRARVGVIVRVSKIDRHTDPSNAALSQFVNTFGADC